MDAKLKWKITSIIMGICIVGALISGMLTDRDPMWAIGTSIACNTNSLIKIGVIFGVARLSWLGMVRVGWINPERAVIVALIACGLAGGAAYALFEYAARGVFPSAYDCGVVNPMQYLASPS